MNRVDALKAQLSPFFIFLFFSSLQQWGGGKAICSSSLATLIKY